MSTEPIKHLASGLTAAEFAAQAWCTDATKNKTMDPELAFAFAAILDRILNELHNWQQDSVGFHRNSEFYRGLLTKIGEGFGIEAKTSDDGSVQEDVLALKVPELVDRLRLALAASQDEAEKAKAELERVVKDRDLGDDELSILYESVASIANGFNVQPPGKICRDSIIAADELRLQRKELTNPFKEPPATRADVARKEPPAKAHGCEVGE